MRTMCYTGTIDPFPYRTSRNTIIPLNIFVCTFFRLYHIIKDHDRYKIPEDQSVKAENILALYIAQSARHVAESDDNEYRSNCVQAYDKVFQSVPSASEDSR